MSWHESVDGVGDQFVPDGCWGVVGAFCKPLMIRRTCIRRALCTTAAFCGAARGTLITSTRNCDCPWSVCGVVRGAVSPMHPASSVAGRTPPVPLT